MITIRSMAVLAGLSITLGALPTVGSAQVGEIGLMAGASYSSLRGIDADNRRSTLGGAYALIPLGGPIQLQVEGLATNRGATPSSINQEIRLSYFEVPVLLRLAVSPASLLNPHVYAGPYVGFRINCRVEGASGDCDDLGTVSTNTTDLGGVAGGGVSLAAGPLVLTGGARYTFGTSTIAEFDVGNAREDAKHGAYTVYVGLGFRLGR